MMKKKRGRKKTGMVVLTVLIVLVVAFAGLLTWYLGIFKEGNSAKYSVAQTAELPDSPLRGKTMIFLGSSVTAGAGALQQSFVDYLVRRDGIVAVKEAVSGTTLTDMKDNSYVARLKKIDPAIEADVFVCQLSTNDATKGMPFSSVSDSRSLADFDTKTVAGAIEYIIVYAQQTWHCPVVFYTSPKFDSDAYGELVRLMQEIAAKWDVALIDLWNDEAVNVEIDAHFALYMKDDLHPMRAGYRELWTPYFEKRLAEILTP